MPAPVFQPFPMESGRRAQVWRHQPAFRRPRHFHPEPEINLVIRGEALLGVGDSTVRLSAGQMVIFLPGQDHELLQASDDLDLFVMALLPEVAARVYTSAALTLSGPMCLPLAELAPLAMHLAALGDQRDAAAIETQVADIFQSATARMLPLHVLSRRALADVHDERHLSIGALAGRLGATPSGVSRRFHRDLGVTFVEFRSRLRLMRFVQLVDDGSQLSRAALEADFGSYAQCHRVFQRALGCSPRDYFRGARTAIDKAFA